MFSYAFATSDIGSRIRGLRQSLGQTQKEFAAALGIVQGFLSAVESGKKTPSDTLLIALCQMHGIRREWLETGEGQMFAAGTARGAEAGSESLGIPLLKRISPNFPEVDPAEIEDYLRLPDLPPGCYALRFEGDFMAPTISDGDLVIFESGRRGENKDIVLVTNRWGEVILRRLRLRGDEVYLAAENASYVPFRPDPETRILGRVTAIWRKVKI
ncbi:LexA family protein [Trichloromonas sp.]|uniref:LexA family protein n=1 Tax=Trichloromonas sp. TaxID=3069249 RepID=UPI002A3FDC0D|nr:XRE family transcriptional regulator [Trichloromonas sp.]